MGATGDGGRSRRAGQTLGLANLGLGALAIGALMLASTAFGAADDAPPTSPGEAHVSSDIRAEANAELRAVTPRGFPPPPREPEDLAPAIRQARQQLGRHLFFDGRLAVDGKTSCARCHRPELAFTDGLPQARGATGDLHPRNTPSLANVAWFPVLTWDDPAVVSLEDHALTPLLGEHPLEMGLAGRWEVVQETLGADPRYRELVAKAFPNATEAEQRRLTLERLTVALAAFQRTLMSADSAYDRWSAGEADALSPDARRGLAIFFSARMGCARCHRGFTFGGPATWDGAPLFLGDRREAAYRNTGLYDIDGTGSYPAANPGLVRQTHRREDRGRFRTPSLRNVALTAPYMHDGSVPTLDAVLDHYAAGGRAALQRGWPSPLADPDLRAFSLDDAERRDLLAFLHSLTDEAFVTNPAFRSPFGDSADDNSTDGNSTDGNSADGNSVNDTFRSSTGESSPLDLLHELFDQAPH